MCGTGLARPASYQPDSWRPDGRVVRLLVQSRSWSRSQLGLTTVALEAPGPVGEFAVGGDDDDLIVLLGEGCDRVICLAWGVHDLDRLPSR